MTNKMYNNLPNRFTSDEHAPQQIFANPRINSYAYNRDQLNVTRQLLDRGVQEYGKSQTAIRSPNTDEKVTYGELQDMVQSIAGGLNELGIESGDRVCYRFTETPIAIATQFAVWQVGGVVVPCPTAARTGEIRYYLNDTEARFLLTDEADIEQVREAVESTDTIEEVVVYGQSRDDEYSMNTLLTESISTDEYASTQPFDAASIFYTGGTTGKPKGCLHSHATEVSITLLECEEGRGMDPTDTLFCPAPIGHSLGNGEMINFPFRFGADTVISHRPSPKRMVEIIEEYSVTIFIGSPTMLRMMMEATEISERDLSSLRMVIVGGENFDETTFNQWIQTTGIEPCNTVGMAQLRHWFLTAYRDGEKFAPGLSVGKPYAGFEMKLVDKEDPQQELNKHGNEGRLAIRGPANIHYWNNIHPDMPEAMEEYTVGDWGLTDDAYRQDKEGFMYFATRLDNMIVSAGRQISGPEVEETLLSHQAVANVAVVGSPDETRGTIIKAFVVLKDEPSEDLVKALQEFVKAEIAPYKYPREIEFVDQLPTDEMGKIQRAELREREYERTPN